MDGPKGPAITLLCALGIMMQFKELGITNSILWFLISIFLFFWLGHQFIGVVTGLEIQNLRTTDLISFHNRPIWFLVVVLFKALVWLLSIAVIYKYVFTKLKAKNT